MTKAEEDGRDFSSKGGDVSVLFVLKRNAKQVKNALEENGWMNKDFRMTPATSEARTNASDVTNFSFQDCIAIPVLDVFQLDSKNDPIAETVQSGSWREYILASGKQYCPFSSSVLGNPSKRHATASRANNEQQWSPLKHALYMTAKTLLLSEKREQDVDIVKQAINDLDASVCPVKVEVLGDDKNLVLPSGALRHEDLKLLFHDNLQLLAGNIGHEFYQELWRQVALAYNSPRVLRKGGVDPGSRIRQTGYQLLWPPPTSKDSNSVSGPGSVHWITVTEQGIWQSFDVSQVMFSRGNISEKIRFGNRLVQKGDVVLDLYAGIGYYTLPAVIHGKASHVYACEWNPRAIQALKYNLEDNSVADKVSVIEGDSRNVVLPGQSQLQKPINRVSLGLLPSSEGGWRTAIQALMGTLTRHESDSRHVPSGAAGGGWLHVHGNVPAKERDLWANWLCRQLYQYILPDLRTEQWVVVCYHVEKVKSFAPTVFHYVADVFVGPRNKALICNHPQRQGMNADCTILDEDEVCFVYNAMSDSLVACQKDPPAPSCALSAHGAHGAIHQDWMMPKESSSS